jgi:hypothetical protein
MIIKDNTIFKQIEEFINKINIKNFLVKVILEDKIFYIQYYENMGFRPTLRISKRESNYSIIITFVKRNNEKQIKKVIIESEAKVNDYEEQRKLIDFLNRNREHLFLQIKKELIKEKLNIANEKAKRETLKNFKLLNE